MRRKSVWETLGFNISTGEFGSLPLTGSKKTVIVEEGAGIVGTVAKDITKPTTQTKAEGIEDSSGDSSVVYQQRHNASHSSHGISGTKVFVTEDQGSGSNVVTTRINDGRAPSRTNTTLGGRYENTRISYGGVGDSNVAVGGSARGSSFRSGQYGGSTGYQQGYSESRGGYYGNASSRSGSGVVQTSGSGAHGGGYYSSSGHQSAASGSNFNVHRNPNVIYSSSGRQTSETSSAESHVSGATASSQDFSVTATNTTSIDGAPVVNQPYPGRVHAGGSNHFTWKPKPSDEQQFLWDQKQYELSEEEHVGQGLHPAREGQSTWNKQNQAASKGRTQVHQGGSGYQNQYDREYHQSGQDVYVGNRQKQSHEQSASGGARSGSNYSWSSQSGRDRSSYGKYGGQNVQASYDQYGIGGSALGQGFRTTTLDLGTLGHVNIDEGVSNESFEQRNRNQPPRVYDPDLETFVERDPRYRGKSVHTREEISYASSSSGVQNSLPRDNVPTDRPDPNRRFVGRRKKRQNEEIFDESDLAIQNIKDCKNTLCRTIRCTVGPLVKDQEALIALRSRVNVHTLRNVSESHPICLQLPSIPLPFR